MNDADKEANLLKVKRQLISAWVKRGADPVKAAHKADEIVQKMRDE